MAKKAAKKKAKASDRKKSAPKKQAVKKKTAKKKAPKKKATQKKTPAKKSSTQVAVPAKAPAPIPAKAPAPKKAPLKTEPQAQASLEGVSTVFASSKTNAWQPYPLLRIIELDEARREMAARKDELDDQHKKAEVAFDLLKKELELQRIRRENQDDSQEEAPVEDYGDVTGMKVCFRTKYGQLTSPLQYVVMVNVASKISHEGLEERKISPLPIAINGTPIKVVEGSFGLAATDSTALGRLATGQGAPAPPTSAYPVIGGQPIAESGAASNFGTLGIVLGDGVTNYGLTNHHVVSNQAIRITTSGSQKVGSVQISDSEPQADPYVDASSILLQLPHDVVSVPYMIKGVNDFKDAWPVYFAAELLPLSVQLEPVYKYGASTNALLEGVIDAIATEVTIPAISPQPLTNVISAKHPDFFIKPGDSGTLFLKKVIIRGDSAWLVVGIVFAQLIHKTPSGELIPDNRVAYACRMNEVIDRLGLDQIIDPNRLVLNSEWVAQ